LSYRRILVASTSASLPRSIFEFHIASDFGHRNGASFSVRPRRTRTPWRARSCSTDNPLSGSFDDGRSRKCFRSDSWSASVSNARRENYRTPAAHVLGFVESDEVRRPHRRRCVSIEQRSPCCADRSRGPPELRGATRPIWNWLKNERRCHVVENLIRVRRVSQLKSCGGEDFAPRLHG
jgi:hypothetical protein